MCEGRPTGEGEKELQSWRQRNARQFVDLGRKYAFEAWVGNDSAEWDRYELRCC